MVLGNGEWAVLGGMMGGWYGEWAVVWGNDEWMVLVGLEGECIVV